MKMDEATKRQRRQRREERKQEEARSQAIHEACADERKRMNHAITAGKIIIVKTLIGPHILDSVTPDWWYHTHPQGEPKDQAWNTRSWVGCNDGDWADMMKQAGLARHPLFAA